MKRRPPRHASRRVALQALYAVDLAGAPRREGRASSEPAPRVDEVFDAVASNFDLPEGARAFAKELVCGVIDRRQALDEKIAAHARNWRLERMAAVDRNILRLAVWELESTDTPTAVVLDEAIELARRFGDDPSPAFVNGVLDAVAGDVERPSGGAA